MADSSIIKLTQTPTLSSVYKSIGNYLLNKDDVVIKRKYSMRIYFSFFTVECNSVLGDPAEILAHLIQFIGNKIACNSIELQPAILPGTN